METNVINQETTYELETIGGVKCEVSDKELCRAWGSRIRKFAKTNGNRPGVVWPAHRPRWKACCCRVCRDTREAKKAQAQLEGLESGEAKREAQQARNDRAAAARKEVLRYMEPADLMPGRRGPRFKKGFRDPDGV